MIESIVIEGAGLGRVRTEVDQLGLSLGTANDRLAAQEAALAAAAERHDRDIATIRRLETELAQRTDLFAKLTTQISAITDTVKEGAVEDGHPIAYSFQPGLTARSQLRMRETALALGSSNSMPFTATYSSS